MTSAEARTVAFMDIGTNSIRFLLVRLHPQQSPTILTQLKQTVRLGEGEFAQQYLQPQAIDRAILVATQFAGLARANGADDIVVVATAATREAANQGKFVQRLQHEAQLDVRVVSGLEEARLIYLGVSSGVHLGDKQALCIDIGGGSTEVIIGTQQCHSYLGSLKLGAMRLTTYFLPGERGPVPPRTYEAIQQYVRHHAVRTFREMRAHRIDLAIGSSGTIENLADVAAQMIYKRPWQRDDVLSYSRPQAGRRDARSALSRGAPQSAWSEPGTGRYYHGRSGYPGRLHAGIGPDQPPRDGPRAARGSPGGLPLEAWLHVPL